MSYNLVGKINQTPFYLRAPALLQDWTGSHRSHWQVVSQQLPNSLGNYIEWQNGTKFIYLSA